MKATLKPTLLSTLLVPLLLILGSTLIADAQTKPLVSTLQEVLDSWRTENDLVGATLAIRSSSLGQIEFASGQANRETGRTLQASTPMYVGSITKTFVAATTLQLVQEGVLSLDDSLSNWYPDYPNSDEISIAQLLNMTSGTFDYFRNSPDNAFLPLVIQDIKREWRVNEIIQIVADFEPVSNPGTIYWYSNTNYAMLGQILQKETGQSLQQILADRLFKPLGLENTYVAAQEPHSSALANGYLRGSAFLFGQEGPFTSDASHYSGLETVFGAAGGLVSTSGDLVTMVNALFSGNVLSKELRAMMLEPTEASKLETTGYGYGVEWFETNQGLAVGHPGSIPGFASLTLYFPEHDLSISVLTNDEQGESLLPDLIKDVVTKVLD